VDCLHIYIGLFIWGIKPEVSTSTFSRQWSPYAFGKLGGCFQVLISLDWTPSKLECELGLSVGIFGYFHVDEFMQRSDQGFRAKDRFTLNLKAGVRRLQYGHICKYQDLR